MAGKGDKPRPVKKEKFDKNFDDISWSSKQGIDIRNYQVKKGRKVYRYP